MANEYHPIKTIQLTKAKSTSLNIGGETSSSNAMKDRTKCQSTHCERQNILNSKVLMWLQNIMVSEDVDNFGYDGHVALGGENGMTSRSGNSKKCSCLQERGIHRQKVW